MKKTVSLLLSIILAAVSLQAQNRRSSNKSTGYPDVLAIYSWMSEERKLAFIEERARYVTTLLVTEGNRPLEINQTAVLLIKQRIDLYAARAGNQSTRIWKEDPALMLERGSKYAPLIMQSFDREGLPPAMGIYLAMIQTEFRPNLTSPANCKGMFQLQPATAVAYGSSPDDCFDVQKSAGLAARYLKDRSNEFGNDGFGMALSLLSYNRSPRRVGKDFQEVMKVEERDQALWRILANPDPRQFDRWFIDETRKYLPAFYAAAIVGETPEAFGIRTQPLSKVAR